MAIIVNLSEHRRKLRTAEIPAGGATIHLFLGVRYERHDDARDIGQSPRPVRSTGRKTRKRA